MEFTFCAITSLPFGANSEEIPLWKKWCLSIHRGRILVKMGENWEDGEMHVFCTLNQLNKNKKKWNNHYAQKGKYQAGIDF